MLTKSGMSVFGNRQGEEEAKNVQEQEREREKVSTSDPNFLYLMTGKCWNKIVTFT